MLLPHKYLKKGWNETNEKKNKNTGTQNLQPGQFGVLVEKVAWNRADLVKVPIPKRKKVGMRGMENKNKNTDTKTYK